MRAPYIREYAASLEVWSQAIEGAPKLYLYKTANGGFDFFCGGETILFLAEDEDGEPVFAKCYRYGEERRDRMWRALQQRDLTPYGCSGKYYEKGLMVFSERTYLTDVLIAPRLQGPSLEVAVREMCQQNDVRGLERLAKEFDLMAEWLTKQDWAHGDLKPENIIITNDGLRLIDFDAAFTPDLGIPRVESGSAEYNHPKRTSQMDDKHIDDWAIAIISINLHALSLNPALMTSTTLPLTAPLFCAENPLLTGLCREFSRHGKARARTLCQELRRSSYVINDIEGVFAQHLNTRNIKPSSPTRFNRGTLWGLQQDGEIVEPAVWDDIICQNDGFFGILDGCHFDLTDNAL